MTRYLLGNMNTQYIYIGYINIYSIIYMTAREIYKDKEEEQKKRMQGERKKEIKNKRRGIGGNKRINERGMKE